MSDVPAVVGEPASQPHHAAVVGEPPIDMAPPVLGEPVLWPNGLGSDQPPVVAPPVDEESVINGIRASNATASAARDAHTSSATSAGDENATSEVARGDEVPHTSAPESANAPQMDTPADAEVTHMADVLSLPPSARNAILIDNPLSILDQVPEDVDLNSLAGTGNFVLADHHTASVEENEPAANSADSGYESGSSSPVANAEAPGDSFADAHMEPPSQMKAVEAEDTSSDKLNDNAASDAPAVVKSDVEQGDTCSTSRDLDLGIAHGNAKAFEKTIQSHEKEKESFTGDASSREAGLSEAVTSEKSSTNNDEVSDLVPDSSFKPSAKDISPEEAPLESSGKRSIPAEETTHTRLSSDEFQLEEGRLKDSGNGISVHRDQSGTEDEKASSLFNLPVILTVVVAVVGVVAVTISRSRQ